MNQYCLGFLLILMPYSLTAQHDLSKGDLLQKKEYHALNQIVGNQNDVYRLNLSSMRNVHDRIAEGKTGNRVHIESIPYQIFPSKVLECYNLHLLHINYHEINEIPMEIDQLKKLRFLDLGYNQLNSLPITFDALTHLEVLNLENNKFDEIPAVIFQLPRLTVLNISANPISVSQKQILRKKMPHLRIIDL